MPALFSKIIFKNLVMALSDFTLFILSNRNLCIFIPPPKTIFTTLIQLNTMHQKKALEFLYPMPTVKVEICHHSSKHLTTYVMPHTNIYLKSSISVGKTRIYKLYEICKVWYHSICSTEQRQLQHVKTSPKHMFCICSKCKKILWLKTPYTVAFTLLLHKKLIATSLESPFFKKSAEPSLVIVEQSM